VGGGGDFKKTIIQPRLVGYEIIIARIHLVSNAIISVIQKDCLSVSGLYGFGNQLYMYMYTHVKNFSQGME